MVLKIKLRPKNIVYQLNPASMKRTFFFLLSLIAMIPLIIYAWWPGTEDIG